MCCLSQMCHEDCYVSSSAEYKKQIQIQKRTVCWDCVCLTVWGRVRLSLKLDKKTIPFFNLYNLP